LVPSLLHQSIPSRLLRSMPFISHKYNILRVKLQSTAYRWIAYLRFFICVLCFLSDYIFYSDFRKNVINSNNISLCTFCLLLPFEDLYKVWETSNAYHDDRIRSDICRLWWVLDIVASDEKGIPLFMGFIQSNLSPSRFIDFFSCFKS
jgi:hypothetical protein